MKPLHSTILASFGGVLAALGLASQNFVLLLPIGGLLFFAGMSVSIGSMAFPEERRPIRWAFGLLGTMALIAAAGSAVYYAYKLDTIGWSWLLVTLPWAVFVFSPITRQRQGIDAEIRTAQIDKTTPEDSLSAVLLIVAVGADLAALRWLSGAQTGNALRSPWEAVSPIYFLWIVLATFCLVALSYRKRYPHLTLGAAALHLFAMLSPALLIYGVGYGFDPFVHQAAERLISAVGEVRPKTPYYIGQYALVTLLSKLSSLPTDAVDRALLPGMAALFLPVSSAWLLRRGFGVQRWLSIIGSFGVLLLPIASFASTTPQGLGNLFFLLALLLGAGWLHAHRPPLGFVLIVALAAAAAHPLAGIPALSGVAILMAVKLRHDGVPAMRIAKVSIFAVLVAAAAIAVPLTFSLRQASGVAPIVETLSKPPAKLLSGIPFEAPGLETRYRPVLDFAEFANRNRDLMLFAMAAAGAWLLGRKKNYRRTALACGGLALALLLAVAILRSGFVFEDVIGYEQANYASRLYETALLALSPLVLAAFAWWWRALSKTDAHVRFFQTLLFAGVAAALAYGWFPRLDEYQWSRGYSPSAQDVDAVRWINEHALGTYLVLADQSVSAAALHEFGFRTYYGEQFYYSIPTGAPLYQHYLNMTYDGAPRSEMEAAMSEIGVPTAYFVIDKYWTDAPDIIDAAKKTADDWQEIDGGELYIFRYSVLGS
jgi:hypothetical protein